MSIHVACSTCHTAYPLETHAGLVRCADCVARTDFRLESAAPNVVELPSDAW